MKSASAAAPSKSLNRIWAGALALGISSLSIAAFAMSSARAAGYSQPGQIGFTEAATPIAEEMHVFHNWILVPIIVGICLFVLSLLTYVILRFNEKANPVPTVRTHNSALEVAWTVLPVMILIIIAIPSFRLLTHQIVVPEPDMTLKVTGHQWYWTYGYPQDQGGFSFDSYLTPDSELKPGQMRLLTVDNEAVVPVGKVVRILITADDVLHSFMVPSFGVRIDAVPGRMNESWFKAEREGVYYGQCSKLCGKDHAYMPIVVRVVSPEDYTAWLAEASKKFASADAGSIRLAENSRKAPPGR